MGKLEPRVLHISHSDGVGGADIAAYRIHQALNSINVDSRMAVAIDIFKGADPTVLTIPTDQSLGKPWLRDHATDALLHLQKSGNGVHRSANLIPSGALPWIAAQHASVTHLHWLGSDTLSIKEIGELPGPVVWTMHDSWPFCGAEHHPEDEVDDRFALGYSRKSRRPGNTRFDFDAWTWRRKKRSFTTPHLMVGPSQWMVDQARRSTLMAEWPAMVIPNPLDTTIFVPHQRSAARAALGLPSDAPLILFGAVGGGAVANKGWDLLAPALELVSKSVPEAHAVVFGADTLPSTPQLSIPTHVLGRIADPDKLSAAYSAANVMVVPSRMESFSQTASEAQGCGTPVVAFAHTGLLDVVDNEQTGLLVTPGSISHLASAIIEILSDPHRAHAMGVAARERAVDLWSYPVVANQYVKAYQDVLESDLNL